MVLSDSSRAGSVGALALYTAFGGRALPVIAVLMAAGGAATGLFGPAWSSIAPRLVSCDQLPAANALSELTPQLALIVGAPLGGVLVALLGVPAALGLNAGSFALAALATRSIRPVPHLPGDERSSPLREALEGVRAVTAQSWLMALLSVEALATFAAVGSISIGLPLLASRGGGPATLGVLLGGFGAGSVIGLLVAGSYGGMARSGRRFCLLQLAQAPLLAAIPSLPVPWAVTVLAAAGVLNGGAAVLYLGLIQGGVAGDVLGRVMSLAGLGAFAFIPLSQVLTGALAASYGLRAVFLLAGAMLAAAGAGGLLSRGLRTAGAELQV
jgi:predicted MFS family arabinose efflux permease